MEEFNRIKDMVYRALDEISTRGELNKESICIIGELVDILKDIGSIEMFEENSSLNDGNYFRNSYDGDMGYSQRNNYNYNGNSYRSGRDNNSFYTGRNNRGMYSREDSRQHMVEKLHELMREATSEKDRIAIEQLINQMST